ncbi:PREDICTED: uncharacterized protein LOC100633676 [Amphimedon queenslandica]|uniref:Death domain-containing protein n=1 Tax=Amphimedon queenslandica TaxID=400682 RepID=A0AAN0ID54_AMPQE|nr:PREDICTED: uncharacterized protein LOC100633676 [Amphimedon queenslandica]|eukprot:XP_003385845.2 PREDICTED: uncharacterized protein LOC100633676 [Amphimedon queenslandica]
MEVDSEMFKTFCDHFCSHCVAMEKNAYKGTQKHYMIAMAEKQEDETTFVDFCCFPCQMGCKQLVMKQCKDEDFAISNLKSIMFDDEGSLSVAFDPDSVPGWERDHNGFHTEEIFESEVDYFKVMGCEAGNVNKENIEMLQMMEEVLSYPPRFRYTFSYLNSFVALDTTKVKAVFSGTSKPLQINVTLKKPQENESASKSQLTPPLTPNISPANDINSDAVLMKILTVTADIFCDDHRGSKWFIFGLKLGLNVSQLHKIEIQYNNPTQFARESLLLWRTENKTATWEPVAAALESIELKSVAIQLEGQFKEQRPMPTLPNSVLEAEPSLPALNNLVGAKIEDKYHLFGIAVGLNEGYLKGLDKDYPTCQERFNQVFYEWSQVDPNTFKWKTAPHY